MLVDLPGQLGGEALQSNTDNEQQDEDPQNVWSATQPSSHRPAGGATLPVRYKGQAQRLSNTVLAAPLIK